MAKVLIRDLNKMYDEVHAVKNVNLEIHDHEFVVLVGPSGCGKTTTLRMVAGLEDITSGEISIDGKVVNDLAPMDRDIAMVFQNYALYPHMSVYDNMAFGLRMRKFEKSEIERRVRHSAEILGIHARPSATRWRCPPESWRGLRSSSAWMPRISAECRTRRSISDFSNLRILSPNAMLSYTLMCGYRA